MKTAIICLAAAAVWAVSDSTPARVVATVALVVAVAADVSARIRRARA